MANWRESANCIGIDTDLFFPDRGEPTRVIQGICARCIVKTECLEFAIADPEIVGYFGGMSARNRQKLRVKRSRQKITH